MLAWHLKGIPRLSAGISSQVAACSWHAKREMPRTIGKGAAPYKGSGYGDLKVPFCNL